MPTDPSISEKKAYQSPVLRQYGDIATLTQAIGNKGAGDSGTVAGMKKTRVN